MTTASRKIGLFRGRREISVCHGKPAGSLVGLTIKPTIRPEIGVRDKQPARSALDLTRRPAHSWDEATIDAKIIDIDFIRDYCRTFRDRIKDHKNDTNNFSRVNVDADVNNTLAHLSRILCVPDNHFNSFKSNVLRLALETREDNYPTPASEAPKHRPRYQKQADNGSRLSPPDFIQQHYAVEIAAKSLHRGFIRREDPELYGALIKWLRTHMLPEDLEIPTLPEWNRKNIEACGPFTNARTMSLLVDEPDPEIRKQIRRWHEVAKKYERSKRQDHRKAPRSNNELST